MEGVSSNPRQLNPLEDRAFLLQLGLTLETSFVFLCVEKGARAGPIQELLERCEHI